MEEQKKYFIISTIMFIVIAILILQIDKYHDNKVNNNYTVETNKLTNQYINLDDFGIYLQNDNGGYDKSSNNKFPTSGFVLNDSMTKCYDYYGQEQTGKVSQTDEGNINLSTTTSIYCKVYFNKDNTPPEIKTFTISGTDKENKTRNDYIYNYGIDYEVTWEADDVIEYCVTDSSSCSEYKKTNKGKSVKGSITLNSNNQGNGLKTLKVYLKDRAKNVSTKDVTITLDRQAPTISGFTLTGNKDTNTSLSNSNLYTHTTNINANVTWSDNDVVSYCITTNAACATNEWTTINGQNATKAITTSTGQGDKKYNAYIKDRVGNVSVVSTGSIYLDTENPTVTMTFVSNTETSITVTVGGTDSGSGINKKECRISSHGGSSWISADNSNNCTISTLSNGSKLTGGTTYTVEARTTDASGRVATKSDNYATKSLNPGDYVKSKSPKGLKTDEPLGGLYRFYGACNAASGGCAGVVDNFVCFGTDDPANDCVGNVESDYMYRIIGIDPNTGNLKLIKNTYIKENFIYDFYWHSVGSSDVEWPDSDLFKRLNGKNLGSLTGDGGTSNLFIDSMTSNVQYIKSTGNDNDTKWYNMIKDTNWLYGDLGRNLDRQSADVLYNMESGRWSTTTGYAQEPYTWKNSTRAKIGLMYLHDYYYSLEGEGSTDCGPLPGCSRSWLVGQNCGVSASVYDSDWTMSRYGENGTNSYFAWSTSSEIWLAAGRFVRPVFYLDATKAKISSGTGTYDDPFIVS